MLFIIIITECTASKTLVKVNNSRPTAVLPASRIGDAVDVAYVTD